MHVSCWHRSQYSHSIWQVFPPRRPRHQPGQHQRNCRHFRKSHCHKTVTVQLTVPPLMAVIEPLWSPKSCLSPKPESTSLLYPTSQKMAPVSQVTTRTSNWQMSPNTTSSRGQDQTVYIRWRDLNLLHCLLPPPHSQLTSGTKALFISTSDHSLKCHPPDLKPNGANLVL